MTIALSVLVSDGMVMATDSATTLIDSGTVLNVFNSANKLFNLHKGLPIGGYTYGAGAIGDASISTLAKDFRMELTLGSAIGPSGWRFDPATYTIEEVAVAVRQFMYEERYLPLYGAADPKPSLGFNVGGYSAHAALPELWAVFIDATGACARPSRLKAPGEYGIAWAGEMEAIYRLLFGYGTGMGDALAGIGLPAAAVPAALTALQSKLEIALSTPAMPIQDTIDLADYLVDLTIKYSRFKAGAPTVGGPVEIAAITKHEGFKWVRRKHYYDAAYNPRGA